MYVCLCMYIWIHVYDVHIWIYVYACLYNSFHLLCLLWDFEFEHWTVICSYRYLLQSYNTI